MPSSNSVFLHLRGMNALLRGQPLVFEDVSITKTNVVDTVRPFFARGCGVSYLPYAPIQPYCPEDYWCPMTWPSGLPLPHVTTWVDEGVVTHV